MGERLAQLAPIAAVRAAAVMYLLLPQIPMLFMGEEWSASQPFPFFCDFAPELAEAVRAGRRRDFAAFAGFGSSEGSKRMTDPQAPETFAAAKLDWDECGQPEHAAWLDLYRQLLKVRRVAIVPLLPRITSSAADVEITVAGLIRMAWPVSGARPPAAHRQSFPTIDRG